MSHADVNATITLDVQLAGELRRAGDTLRRWMAAERTDGPAALAPNAIVRFGPSMLEDFSATEGEVRLGTLEAARTINTFEAGAGAPATGEGPADQ